MTRSRAALAALALLLAASLMVCPSTALGQDDAQPNPYLSTAFRVSVKSSPSADAPELFVLRAGTFLEVDQCRDGWCEVTRVGRGSGWITESDLIEIPDQTLGQRLRLRRMLAAKSARRGVECPVDIEWPRLPASGRQVFRVGMVGFGEPPLSEEQVEVLEQPRTDIAVPQYAFLYHKPRGEWICSPVIVVQASQVGALGWWSVLREPRAAGGAGEEFFDLLGVHP